MKKYLVCLLFLALPLSSHASLDDVRSLRTEAILSLSCYCIPGIGWLAACCTSAEYPESKSNRAIISDANVLLAGHQHALGKAQSKDNKRLEKFYVKLGRKYRRLSLTLQEMINVLNAVSDQRELVNGLSRVKLSDYFKNWLTSQQAAALIQIVRSENNSNVREAEEFRSTHENL
jgi:hypothetical protein